MALTGKDKALLQRCLEREPGAWVEFVDRFLGLVYHTIHHTAYLRSVHLQAEDVEDIAADCMSQLVADEFQALRQFRGQSSLGTYLTVIARRVCVHELIKRIAQKEVQAAAPGISEPKSDPVVNTVEAGLENLEEVQKLLRKLPAKEREIVRLSYLEGRSYEEIATEMSIPVNTIGPILTRARRRLRKDVAKAPPVRKLPELAGNASKTG